MRRSTSRRPGLTLAKPRRPDRAGRTTFGWSQKLDPEIAEAIWLLAYLISSVGNPCRIDQCVLQGGSAS